jgi:hypothetical protein
MEQVIRVRNRQRRMQQHVPPTEQFQRHTSVQADTVNLRVSQKAGPDTRRNSVIWGVAGFVAGALFWHSIGFWSFVQSTLLPGPDVRRADRDSLATDVRVAASANGSYSLNRPVRGGTKAAGKLQQVAPSDVPTVVALTPEAPIQTFDCVSVVRGAKGPTPCGALPLPLTEGRGLTLADKTIAKRVDVAGPAALVWQAKVEVSQGER